MTEAGATGDARDGMLIQGTDGAIYFIPSERLEEFRVSDEGSAKARESIEHLEAEVAGFDSLSFDLKPGVATLKAFEGPLAFGGPKVSKTKTMYQLGGPPA